MNTKKALASVLITTACSTGTAGPAMPKPHVATGEVGAPPAIACSPSAHYEAERGCTEDLYGVPLRVTHQNAMTSSFRLVGVALALDGVDREEVLALLLELLAQRELARQDGD